MVRTMQVMVQLVRAVVMVLGGLVVLLALLLYPVVWQDPVTGSLNGIYLMVCGVLVGFVVSRKKEQAWAHGVLTLVQRVMAWPPRKVLGGVLGLTVALFLSSLLSGVFAHSPFNNWVITTINTAAVTSFFVYFGVLHSDFFAGMVLPASEVPLASLDRPKVLDLSTILDGRVVDLLESHFLEGTLVAPLFVVHELQRLADHADAGKRARARKGLEVLDRLHALTALKVLSSHEDSSSDLQNRVLLMAVSLGAKVLSVDYHLHERGREMGVMVINLQHLMLALNPPYATGDRLRVRVMRDGNEPGQGIAYLDDGTLLVVEAGAMHKGQEAEVVVVSFVQTQQGRMIFARAESA